MVGDEHVKWPLITLALLLACVAGAAWIALRDRDAQGLPGSERAVAQAATARIGPPIGALRTCSNCGVKLLDRLAPRVWRVRVVGRSQARCFAVDLDRLDSSQSGFSGMRLVTCPRSTTFDMHGSVLARPGRRHPGFWGLQEGGARGLEDGMQLLPGVEPALGRRAPAQPA